MIPLQMGIIKRLQTEALPPPRYGGGGGGGGGYRSYDRGYDRGYDRYDRGYDRGYDRYDRGYGRGNWCPCVACKLFKYISRTELNFTPLADRYYR